MFVLKFCFIINKSFHELIAYCILIAYFVIFHCLFSYVRGENDMSLVTLPDWRTNSGMKHCLRLLDPQLPEQ